MGVVDFREASTRSSCDPPSHSDQSEKSYGADSRRNDLPDDIATREDSEPWQQGTADNGTNDADHDVSQHAKTITLDNDTGQETSHSANEQQDQESFSLHDVSP
jgi:hypothetical protein